MKEQYNCKKCGDSFFARKADRARGWARFCSKSCKAKEQENRTGQYAGFLTQKELVGGGGEWDEHKNYWG
jgi:hypothetical protein